MSGYPDREMFELVTWADVIEGDHVWSMGGVCVITRGAFRDDSDRFDCILREGVMRFGHRYASGSEFAPPMDLRDRVPRLIPPAEAEQLAFHVIAALWVVSDRLCRHRRGWRFELGHLAGEIGWKLRA